MPTPVAGTSHDLTLYDGTNTTGFLLAEDPRTKEKRYSLTEVDHLRPRISQSAVDVQDLDPLQGVPWERTTFHGGLSYIRRDLGDDTQPFFFRGNGLDTRRPDQVILPPASTQTNVAGPADLGTGIINCWCKFNNIIFAGTSAGDIYQWNGTNWVLTWAAGATLTTPITSMAVHKSRMYVAHGSTGYKYTTNVNDVTAWVEVVAGVYQFSYFAVMNDQLWGLRNDGSAAHSAIAAPVVSASWTTAYAFDSTDLFMSLRPYNGLLYIAKQNAVYTITGAGAIEQLFKLNPKPRALAGNLFTGGRCSEEFQGRLYFTSGNTILQIEYVGGSLDITDIGPAQLCPGYIPGAAATANGVGAPVGLAASRDWLWVYWHDTATSTTGQLWAGRNQQIAGEERWVWHPIRENLVSNNLEQTGGNLLFFSDLTTEKNRLWLQNQNGAGGDRPNYILTPDGDPLADTAYRYDVSNAVSNTDHFLEVSIFDFGQRMLSKGIYSIFVDTALLVTGVTNTTSQQQIRVDYSLDGAAFVTLGSNPTYTTNPTAETLFPANTTCRSLTLRFYLSTVNFGSTTNANTLTPALRGFVLRAGIHFLSLRLLDAVVQVGEGLMQLDGQPESLDRATQITRLQSARDAVYPITVRDETNGNTAVAGYVMKIQKLERVRTDDPISIKGMLQYRLLAYEVNATPRS